MLAAEGHQVIGDTGEITQAVSDIARLDPEVVLLDLNLANSRSGLEALPEIRKRGSRARILVLTASAQPRHIAEAMRQGATGYVLKGAPKYELMKAIEVVAGGGKYLGQDGAEAAVAALSNDPEKDALGSLSARERQIMIMVVKGHSSARIGAELNLSPRTVDTYRGRTMVKLGLPNVPALVRYAIRSGLIDAEDE